MNYSPVRTLVLVSASLCLSGCGASREVPRDEAPKITVTTVRPKPVTLTRSYVCRIQSRRRIEVRTPAKGHLAAIPIREGQEVKRDDLLFQVRTLLDKRKPGNENENKVVSIRAPFDGIVGRLPLPQGRFVQVGEPLTNLCDNSLIRADFKVSEARHFEAMSANPDRPRDERVELVLANGDKFHHPGTLAAVESEFRDGTISYRADFPNPDHLLRDGQSGTLLISRVQDDAVVIPRRATLVASNRRYVYLVDQAGFAHRHEVDVANELEDVFVIKKGLEAGDRIVLEGIRLVRDGDRVEDEDRRPSKLVGNLK